jgi:hypothetical protein
MIRGLIYILELLVRNVSLKFLHDVHEILFEI